MTEQVDRAAVFGQEAGDIERIAPGYFGSLLEAEHVARYRWAARMVQDRSVLDVACGTGYGVVILRRGGARTIVSADLSHDALRFGVSSYSILPVRADANLLPVRDAVFQVVVSLETIEHLDDQEGFAQEVYRVLRPGGHFLVSTPNSRRSSGTNPYHVHEFTLEELSDLLRRAGLPVEGIWRQKHWNLPFRLLARVPGVGRLSWVFERRARVTARGPRGGEPMYWLLLASKLAG